MFRRVHEASSLQLSLADLLCCNLAIALDVDMVVGGKRVDLVVWELGTGTLIVSKVLKFQITIVTHVKPLIKVYSSTILPPCSCTCFLAL